LSAADQPTHGSFIITPNSFSSYNWRSPQNNNLWQGVNGVNNPCPYGYHVPTFAELATESSSWSQNNSAGAFASPLKLPVSGYRLNSDGSPLNVGNLGYYWSSTVNNTSASYLSFSGSNAGIYNNYRASGYAVRCLKD
jgi:hypothetical protein